MAPDASVVVASFCGEPALRRCLQSLEPQADAAEVIVATDVEIQAVARLEARFPRFRFLPAPRGTSVFRLRAMGVPHASAPMVALTEDHCTADPGWLEALRAEHAAGHAVVGGAVENGIGASAYDWALYLCEYAAHMPPLRDGPARTLTGVNVAYDREALAGCRGVWSEAFYENEVHDALQAAGHPLRRAGSACVTSHLALPFRQASAHLFRGGQRFGAYRRGRASPTARALLPVAAPAVPALLTWRVARTIAARRPRLMGTFARALGHVAVLNGAWAAGEALGYLRSAGVPATEPLARPR